MTILNLKTISKKFIAGAAALALMAGVSPAFVHEARADECLLDTNDNGLPDAADTDGGAVGSMTGAIACGGDGSDGGSDAAQALGENSTAFGTDSAATGTDAVAIGAGAQAVGFATAFGRLAIASASETLAIGQNSDATGLAATAVGTDAQATSTAAVAVGRQANAAGSDAIAIGRSSANSASSSLSIGAFANATAVRAIAIGHRGQATGVNATAIGAGAAATNAARASGARSIALGGGDGTDAGASAQGDDSIVIGSGAGDADFDGAIVIGKDAVATEADQVVLQDATTFTILGDGRIGVGTVTPDGKLDIDTGPSDTLFMLTNATSQWELKSNATTGRLTYSANGGTKPFKIAPDSVENLLRIGVSATNEVSVAGNLVTTGTLTTGGPTCGGGCDAVFDADYDLPSIEEHAKQMFANKHLPEVGPTTPEAPLNVTEYIGSMLNELEKAHIYIAQLESEARGRDAKLAELDEQVARLARLEKLLTGRDPG